jgi:hypothetical protein
METPDQSILSINRLKYLSFIALGFFYSCSSNLNKDIDTFIVPEPTKAVIIDTLNNFPPPPPARTYYFPFNFIVDSAGQIFFYQLQLPSWTCMIGRGWDTPPEFIDLHPTNIVRVPEEGIPEFIKLNILTQDSSIRRVAIASMLDTIHSPALSKVMAVLQDSASHAKWLLRKTTMEEEVVLDHKKKQRAYLADEIKWDSTKVLYPPKIDVIDFWPPTPKNN